MFKYPEHFTYPEDTRIWFNDHIENWEHHLQSLIGKPNVCLEIGAYHGASSTFIREMLCDQEGSHLYIMDINKSPYLESNIKPYDNITFMQGESRDSFRNFSHNGETKEFLDFVYIDGSHMSLHVLEDAVNAFYCLKDGGVMIFDDYLGGLEQASHMQVKYGVDGFVMGMHHHLMSLFSGYQLGLVKKTAFTDGELKENYYNGI
jgi:predicted O-methyltransferase YrrM